MKRNIMIQDYLEHPVDMGELWRCVRGLGEKEKFVLYARYDFDGNTISTFEAIAKKMNVSKERVIQIHKIAIHKLLHPLRVRVWALDFRK